MSKLNHKDEKRLEQARTAYLQNQVEFAVRSYEQLLTKFPQHVPIIAELSQIYLRFGRVESAEPLLGRLLQKAQDLNSLLVAGRGLKRLGDGRRAVEAFRKALKGEVDLEQERQLRCEIIILTERMNDLVSAEAEVKRLIGIAPEHPETQFLLGFISARKGQFLEAERFFQKVLVNPSATKLMLSQTGHELGKVLDQLERYDEAFQVLDAAKTIELPKLREERVKAIWMADLISRVAVELNEVSPTLGATPAQLGPSTFGRPLCVLTGHPRSGTTLLEQMLASHSKVSTADESSSFFHSIVYPHVFPTFESPAGAIRHPLPKLSLKELSLTGVSVKNLQSGIDEYRRQLERLAADFNSEHYIIDKCPGGLIDLPVFEAALPETKVIVVLRDPRDICISCFQQFFGVNLISVNFNTLENAAAKIVRDFKFWIAFRAVTKLNWIEIHYEQLIANPEFELRRAIKFLELDWEPAILSYTDNVKQKQVHSPTYAAVAKPVYHSAIGRWKNYRAKFPRAEQLLNPIAAALNYPE